MATIEALTSDLGGEITDSQILQLQREAAEAGDEEQVALCERALRGSQSARVACNNAIADARAMEVE